MDHIFTIEHHDSDKTAQSLSITIKANELVIDLKKEIVQNLSFEVKHINFGHNGVWLMNFNYVPDSSILNAI